MCTGKYRLGSSTGGGYNPVRKILECHLVEVDITFNCQTIYHVQHRLGSPRDWDTGSAV